MNRARVEMTNRAAIEASAWIERRRSSLDPAAERAFAAWRGANRENAQAFARLDAMAGALRRAREHGTASDIIRGLGERARRRTRRWAAAGMTVAAILVAGGALWTQSFVGSATSPTVAVARGFEPLRRLPDGSVVELKSGAELVVRFDPTTRRVELLRGEAIFRVEPDASRPFVVQADGIEVRAVGTAFHVALGANAVDVLVTEGKVRVDDTGPNTTELARSSILDQPVLAAGQSMAIERNPAQRGAGPARIRTVSPDEIRQRLAWRLPRFEFDGTELRHATAELNRVNRLQLVIVDSALARERITGGFAPDDPETFARLAAATFGLRLRPDGTDRLVLERP